MQVGNRPEGPAVERIGVPGIFPKDEVIGHEGTPTICPAEAIAIREQLRRLLGSQHLRNSRRCQALLKFVVEAHLDGHLEKVKERCIGFEVFQRDADYDTSQDSVVRTAAAEVRKRLAQYYLEPEHANEIRFVLPHGSYSPEFHFPELASAQAPVDGSGGNPAQWQEPNDKPIVEQQIGVSRSPRRHWYRKLLIAALPVVAAMIVAACFYLPTSDFDRFWKPMLQDRAPVVICVEQPLRIYRFTGPRLDDLNNMMVGPSGSAPTTAESREKSHINLAELSPVGSHYFTVGDFIATARLCAMLSRKGKAYEILSDRLTSYRDVFGKPAIMLGQYNNQWTRGLTNGLRYYMDKDPVGRRYEVRDRKTGKIVLSTPRSDRPEEFAIISRLLNPPTERPVVTVVASTYFGTLAAGEFLTNPEHMRRAWQDAPSGWYKKNLQIVLRFTRVHGVPGPPRMVATYFW